ncbi:probable E3 ubiquitin-protein ligase HECTD2 [Tetranychus urticae]|uniref:HECT-type E3 ubiquitin transferase n=1 Tax=Tetranychus urticae TaxID=32264 RepID=T1KZ90_TETUR|nr:probable E3 ubiquitin-protein ligase HECTD2 [Tetranychus urticae]
MDDHNNHLMSTHHLPHPSSPRETLICRSCRISLESERPRAMCPFCGAFYSENAENDYNMRSRSLQIDEGLESNDNLRLPRIRPNLFRFNGFGPFLTDSIGLIHSYLASLLVRSPESESNIYLHLPPITRATIVDDHSAMRRSFIHPESPSTFDHLHRHRGSSISSSTVKSINDSESVDDNKSYSDLPREYSSMYPSPDYPKRYLNLDQFRSLVHEAHEEGDYTKLHDLYKTSFSSFVEINALFKKSQSDEEVKLHDPELQMNLVYAMFDELDNLPSFIVKSVLKGVVNSINNYQRLKPKDETRAIYMIVQLPTFSFQFSYPVFAHLLKKTVNLQGGDHQLLVHWFSRSEPEKLRKLVKRVLQFITIREFPPSNGQGLPAPGKCRWWIPCAARFLDLLNSANNKVTPNLIPYTEFYNSALDHINLMSEFNRWQNPSKHNKFSYCQYPFLLSIVAKKTILQRDSEQQMIINARKSLLNRAIYQQAPDMDVFFLNLNIRRSSLVSDSLHEIARKQIDLKKKLKVTFVGEPGLDMGGLTKEWFLLLIRQIFSEDYGMFVYHSKARCYWFSTASNGNLKEYNLIGVLMGLGVYNSIILDLHFPQACYKKLLNPPVAPKDVCKNKVGVCKFTLDHFAEVMPDVAVGLKELLAYEGNVEEDFCMTFQVSVEEFGQVQTHVLKPGGEDIPVTNRNREEYVQLYMDLILNKAIYQPFEAFYLGFHSVCTSNTILLLRPEEVEVLVCGSPTIDMDELRKVTIYDGFHEDEPIIKEFWSIIKSFSLELQRQFLRFVSGSDRVPVGGMSEMIFKISATDYNTDMLPTSHTCFNQLVLPRYKDKSTIREKLVIAISNAEGFGLE